MVELRSLGVDGGDVGGSSSCAVVLETEACLEATGKWLVRDRSTGDGVQEENFSPRRSAAVGRVDLDFSKHCMERCQTLGLFLEELPNPVLEHGVRVFAVAGNPRFTHRTMQVLLFCGRIVPFNNREHDNPHVRGPELVKKQSLRSRRSPGSLTFTLQAVATASSAVISNSFVPNVVGGARTV